MCESGVKRLGTVSAACWTKLHKSTPSLPIIAFRGAMQWLQRAVLRTLSPAAGPPLQGSSLCASFSETKEPSDLGQFTKGDAVEEKEHVY